MSNQGLRQASVRAVTGTALTYEGDWHALFDAAGIPAGDFNGRMLAWCNDRLGVTYPDLPGAMQAFAVSQGYYNWDSMGTFDAGGFEGILDQLATAPFAAYSLRRLTVDYEGSAIRVRESSGNTEADIGFDSNGDLDTAALLAHCGSNDGFITIWYDQVGSNDLKQTTAGAQPRIVSAGTVDTKNSVPMARMLGTVPNGTRFMLTDAFTAYTGTTLAAAVAVSLDASQGFYRRILGAWNGTNDTGATAAILAMANNAAPATGYATYRNSGERSNVAGDIGGVNVVWSDYDAANGQIATEAAAGSAGASTGAFSVVRFILSSDSASSASFSMVGYVGEMIVFTTLPSGGDETTLRDDMATFYGA